MISFPFKFNHFPVIALMAGVFITAQGVQAQSSPAIENLQDGSTVSTNQVVRLSPNGTVIEKWAVHAGSSKGRNDYYESGVIAADVSEHGLRDLPAGQDAHITLWYKNANGDWLKSAFYAVKVVASQPTTPTITNIKDGDTIGTSQMVEFSANGTSVERWAIHAGATKGSNDYYESGVLVADASQHTLQGLPKGKQAHITLWYKDAGGEWIKAAHYEVTIDGAVSAEPALTNLSNGANIKSTQRLEFSSNGTDVQYWWIRIGSSIDGQDLLESGVLESDVSSYTVENLPVGITVYMKLFYYNSDSTWVPVLYEFSVTDSDGMTLTKSDPVEVTADNTVIERLDIKSDSHDKCGIRLVGRKNVTIRNVNITHAGAGICVHDSDNVKIETVRLVNTINRAGPHCKPALSVAECKVASRERNSKETEKHWRVDSHNNINISKSTAVSVDKAYVEKGESGIYVYKSPKTSINNLQCKDIRGPYWRGQCVQFVQSDGGLLTNFYVKQFLETSSGHDNINAFDSSNVTVRNGLVDGNYSRNGVGVIADSNAHKMTVEDVDFLNQGPAAVNAWSGSTSEDNGTVPSDFTGRNLRARDGICTGSWYGPDVHPSSGGRAFTSHPLAKNVRVFNSQYWNHGCDIAVWMPNAAVVQIVEKAFTAKQPPVDMAFPWMQ